MELTNREYKNMEENNIIGNNCITSSYNCIARMMGNVITCICIPFCTLGPIKVIEQGNAGILTRYGKYKGTLNPGRYTYNTCIDNIIEVSLKNQSLNITTQRVMTKDNLTIMIDAVCFYKIENAKKVLFAVKDYEKCILNICQSTLRTVIGESELTKIFENRTEINKRMSDLLNDHMEIWGIGRVFIEIKDVEIPKELQRVMAILAESKQEAQAKLVAAEADCKSAEILYKISEKLKENPIALELIWYNTLKEVSKEKSNTIVLSKGIENIMGIVQMVKQKE
jgi:regulator of protease activity HflC (stomatin/prohibitin superfamily)